MLARLLLLFILTPLIELWLLLAINSRIGLGATIMMVLVTGSIGASLARRQGLQTWIAIQRETARGAVPGAMLIDGLLIFIAGLLLITPGVLTDLVGFSLLIPAVRAGVRARLRDALVVRSSVQIRGFGQVPPDMGRSGFPPGASPGADAPLFGQPPRNVRNEDIIDVEFERRDD